LKDYKCKGVVKDGEEKGGKITLNEVMTTSFNDILITNKKETTGLISADRSNKGYSTAYNTRFQQWK
jgi:hypothetical protein